MQPLVWTAAVMTLLLAPLATALALHPQRRQIDWITEPRPRQLPGLFVWFTELDAERALRRRGTPRARGGRHRMAARPDRARMCATSSSSRGSWFRQSPRS